MKIQEGTRVELDYQLLDKEGEVIETSDDSGRIIYTHGASELPPPLEAALDGALEGDTREVLLAPADAFGERDLESIFSVPTDLIGDGTVPRSGDWIDMVVEPDEGDEFTEPYELEAQVISVDDDAVILDTNHPLAGQEVTFQVTVAALSGPE
jgi:FKBP-type peptidyl-prolyl cis-trans isomerase 2